MAISGPQYRIRDWDTLFENSRSRSYKKLDWVPIPNRHDGKGFRRLIAYENGPALFAAWVLIVQVGSKCPQRGVLADEDGPLDADDLSLKTGCPADVFAEAFRVLCLPKIGWLEVEEIGAESQLPDSSLTDAVSMPTIAVSLVPLNRIEEKEEKRITEAADAAAVVGAVKKSKAVRKTTEPIVIPVELDKPEFRTAWHQWREHRSQLKKSMTALAESKALEKLVPIGMERAVAAINHSIANGWQGIFEPNNAAPMAGSQSSTSRMQANGDTSRTAMQEHSQKVLGAKLAEHQERLARREKRRAAP